MRLLNPEMADWLLALPVAYACWFLYIRGKRRFRRRSAIGDTLAGHSRLSTSRRDLIGLVAVLIALASVAFALMRPQILIQRRVPEYQRQDLVLILDRSASMRAQDIKPSRFTRAIHEIKTFLSQKPEGIDRVGLVGFAGAPIILSYLTRDLDNIIFYLDWILDDEEPRFGTDMGAALASARELAHKDKKKTPKVFLLVSDGEDQGERLANELMQLREERTPVFCIGVGSENRVPIPAPKADENLYLLDDENRPLVTRFSERTLQNIANTTGGRYFRSMTGKELAPALQTMVRAEKRIISWKTTVEYLDLYLAALASAAAATFVVLLTL